MMESEETGTVFKPLSDVERVIENTSTADFILFCIALHHRDIEQAMDSAQM